MVIMYFAFGAKQASIMNKSASSIADGNRAVQTNSRNWYFLNVVEMVWWLSCMDFNGGAN